MAVFGSKVAGPVPPLRRLSIAVLLGMLAALITHMFSVLRPEPRDIAIILRGSRALLDGQDPYAIVRGLTYPLPGLVAMVPWALPPQPAASALFMYVSAAAFAWALMEQGYAPLLGFFSPGMLFAAQVGQWSPLFAAALVIAPLGAFLIVKPHVGLAIYLARPTWWAAASAFACGVIAFVVQPTWLLDWRASLALAGAQLGTAGRFVYTSPVTLSGGVLVLAALARWRRPEARLLVVLAIVPQSLHLYEIVPLALIPRGWRESGLYLAGTHLVWRILQDGRPWEWYPDYMLASGTLCTLFVFLPATMMVLGRPNEGALPAWIEARIATWPDWLKGRAVVRS
jgi:hypothetical protein